MSDEDQAFFRSAFIGALILALLDALFLSLGAQSLVLSDTARARAVVQRHMEAVGGEKALAAKHTHMVLTMSMPGSVAVIRQEDWRSLPRFYSRMEVPGIGTTEMGSDGKVSWMISPQLGPMIMKDSMIPGLKRDDPTELLDHKAMTYLGLRDVAGKRYDAVLFLVRDSANYTVYFDPRSGLMAGMNFEKAPVPPGQMAMSFDEWRRFGAVLYATRTTVRMADGKEIVTRVESMSTDPINPRVYDLPVKVRGLQTKKP